MSAASRPAAQEDLRKKYMLNAEDIKNDLTEGQNRPLWIFSAYGPGKNAPVQLFGGPEREQSFEEMRALHYAATAAGNPEKAVQDANNLYTATEAQIKTILADLEGAIKYVLNGANEHPNRNDIADDKVLPPTTQQNAFGSAMTGQTPAFGQPTPLSQGGQTSAPAFGQPSALSQSQAPAFGKPAFGQPAFGQPSALGQQSGGLGTTQPAFGQPSAMNSSPFGQPVSNTSNPFGQTSSSSPFAQATNQAFGQPQSQSQSQGPSPFAKPEASGFGQPQTTNSPFGQPSSTTPFGAPSPQKPTPFGQSSGFGAAAPTIQPPTQSTQPIATSTSTATLGSKNDLTKLNPLPPISGETRRDPSTKKLILWKGRPVKYVDNKPCFQHPDDPATLVHIFFPDGPPAPETFKYSVGKPEDYTPEVESAYRHLKEHGAFLNGIMPSVPPKPEWCGFDL